MLKAYSFICTDAVAVDMEANKAYFTYAFSFPDTPGELPKENVKRITARTLQAAVNNRQKGRYGKVYYGILDNAYNGREYNGYLGEFSSWHKVKKFIDSAWDERIDLDKISRMMKHGLEYLRELNERYRTQDGDERTDRANAELARINEFVSKIDRGFEIKTIGGIEHIMVA